MQEIKQSKSVEEMTDIEKREAFENALLRYVINVTEDQLPETAQTIPAVAGVLIEFWREF